MGNQILTFEQFIFMYSMTVVFITLMISKAIFYVYDKLFEEKIENPAITEK